MSEQMMIIQKLWSAFLSGANKRSKTLLPALLLVLTTTTVRSEDTSLPIYEPELVQKNQTGPKYKVGDRIQYRIRLPLDLTYQNSSIQLKPSDPGNGVEKAGIYLDPSPQIINGTLQFSIYPVKTGSLTLPELLLFKNDDQPIGRTNSINIFVEELQQNPNEKPQLIDAQPIPLPFRFVLYGLFSLLTLSLIAYVLFQKYKPKPKAKTVEEIKIPPIPDNEIATKELLALFERYSFSSQNLKPIAFGVSQILKNYFSSRFKVDARESTTDEMLSLLRHESIPSTEIEKIAILFKDLDLIKFTDLPNHHHFQKTEYIGFKDQAKQIIDRWANKETQP